MAVYTRASIRGLAKGLVRRDLILAGVSLLVVFAILLMITQLAVLFYSSLRHVMLFDPGPLNLDNFYEVIADSKFVSVAANTLTLGVGTVIIMLLFAVPFSVALHTHGPPAQRSSDPVPDGQGGCARLSGGHGIYLFDESPVRDRQPLADGYLWTERAGL